MSHDVERLAKVLYEGMPCPLGRWEDLSDAVRGTWFAIARSAMKAGVTLPTPPRAETPLEAAARASVEPDHRWELLSETGRATVLREMRRAITAAVGALSDEAAVAAYQRVSAVDHDELLQAGHESAWAKEIGEAFRSVVLARLTEGGAA